jgi:hypothetical protein
MAQSISGTQLAASWAALTARVAIRVRADWNQDGDYGDAYEDISDRVLGIQITHSLYDPLAGLPYLGNVAPGSCRLTLDNHDRWFSPDNAAGLAGTYTNLASGIYRIPVIVEMGYYDGSTPERLTQFVGEMEEPGEAEVAGQAQVTVICRDNAIALMQEKLSTGLMEDWRADQVVDEVLTLAGFAGSTDLDIGAGTIPYAWLDDENAWDECRDLAAAEGGMFYMGKEGAATFRRMTAPLERADSLTPVATLDEGNATYYGNSIAWRDTYSDVILEYAGRYQGDLEEVWSAPGYFAISPGETVTEEIRYRYPVTAVFDPVYDEDYHCVTAGGHQLDEGAGGITITLASNAQGGTLTMENDHASQTAYVLDLVVRGFPLLGEETQTLRFETTLSPPLVEGKTFRLRGNPYMQTREQSQRLGGFLRDRLQRPRRLLTWRGPACPWIELLDRVTLSHNSITPNPGVDLECYVVANSMACQGPLWTQELLLLPVADVWAYEDYFILGTSVYADTGSDKAAY